MLLISCAFTSHVSSTIEQPTSSAKSSCGRQPSYCFVGTCWRYETLIDDCHTGTCCKASLFVARCAVTFVSLKMVYLCPVSSWQFKSWLPDSGVINKERVDHRGLLAIVWLLTDTSNWSEHSQYSNGTRPCISWHRNHPIPDTGTICSLLITQLLSSSSG